MPWSESGASAAVAFERGRVQASLRPFSYLLQLPCVVCRVISWCAQVADELQGVRDDGASLRVRTRGRWTGRRRLPAEGRAVQVTGGKDARRPSPSMFAPCLIRSKRRTLRLDKGWRPGGVEGVSRCHWVWAGWADWPRDKSEPNDIHGSSHLPHGHSPLAWLARQRHVTSPRIYYLPVECMPHRFETDSPTSQ